MNISKIKTLAGITSVVALVGSFSAISAVFNDKDMVTVPAGEFTRGCTRSESYECMPEALPAKKIFVSGFKIDKYLVTFRRYNECLASGACTDLFFGSGCDSGMPWNKDHPVNCVTYHQAEAFCKWDGNKRLPTEAEWEKAARGTDKRNYPWGNQAPSCELATMSAKTKPGKMLPGCGMGTSNPVNSKPKGVSPYGAFDMVGNEWEWTSDWYDPEYYKKSPTKDPKGPKQSTGFKSVKGASWLMREAVGMDISVRTPYAPEGQGYIVSFRCAKSL
ncbi:formylglycine-generating enzyme family protein [Parashewanella tropica]|uniref:formylglycine-generating enzyme family protein n=1 Tax=Parashewanella tropica TaxID=2547970 RepID=UPI00105AA83B|nr:formylglycine-generating enzyme family protein [Parashewanella tropica]